MRSSLLGGLVGGLIVLAAGAALLATDVIETGDTTEVVRQPSIVQPADSNGSGEGPSIGDIYRREGAGVVFVSARGVSGDSPFGLPSERGVASGSGFVIDGDGFILTNAHVVEGSDDVTVRFGRDGEPVDADVRGSDPSSDLALLKIDPEGAKLNPIPFEDSSKVRVGDPVLAIGNPFGLELDRTVTSGIVSAIQRSIEAPNGFTIQGAIQTDASINPGNSGGPLLNANGRVIGINSQIATGGGGGSVGIGFAVPSNLAKTVVGQLRREGRVERAFIGITTTEVTEEVAKELDLAADRGAMVVDVFPGSPAAKAGFRPGRIDTISGERSGGDVIVRVAGRPVRQPEDLTAAIARKKPGERIEIEYYRGRSRKTVEIELEDRPTRRQRSQVEPEGPPLLP